MLISQFEGGENNITSLSNSETSLTGSQLEIPLHIRREQQLSGSYSPAKVEQALTVLHASGILNTTSIVRHYFENVSRGATDVGLQRRHSNTELEDSGFQVGISNLIYLFLVSPIFPQSLSSLPCPFRHLSLPPFLPPLPPSLPPSLLSPFEFFPHFIPPSFISSYSLYATLSSPPAESSTWFSVIRTLCLYVCICVCVYMCMCACMCVVSKCRTLVCII